MVRFSLLFLFTFVSFISNAQILPDGISLQVSQEFTTNGKERIQKIVSSTDERTVVYTRYSSNLEFLVFDKDLQLTNSNVVQLKSGSKGLSFLKVIETNSGIFVFSTLRDEVLNREVLYYQQLNITDLTLGSANILHSKSGNSGGGAIHFFIEVSPNKEFLMVDVSLAKSSDNKDFGLETFDVLVFDSGFDKVWREDAIELFDEDEQQRFFRDKRMVTNDAKVLMMGLQISGDFNEIVSSEDVMNMFKYYMVVLKKAKEHVMYELQSEEGYFAALNYKLADDGYLYVATVAYDKVEDVRSWYFSVLDIDSGNFVVENKSEFEETQGVLFNTDNEEDELVALLRLTPYINVDAVITSRLAIKDIFVDVEGTTVVFQSHATSNSYYYKGVKTIIGSGAVRFNHEGEQQWAQGVQKVQSSRYQNNLNMSVSTINSNGGVSFIFNFVPMKETNGNLKKEYWEEGNKADLYLATIDNTGDLSINLLLEGGKKVFWTPRVFSEVGKGEIIIAGGYGKENKLARVKIDK